MQRAGETGQLLPTITPFNGVQQDPMGYDALAIQVNIPQSVQENYVRMARYENQSGSRTKLNSNKKEHFEYMDSEKPTQNQNFDTSGQIADLLNMFSDYKVKLTPAMQ